MMKRMINLCICTLLLLCSFAPAAFAEDLSFNTINDQAQLYNEETSELYTIGYTVVCSSETDWNLQSEPAQDAETFSYTASVERGSVLSAQLNSQDDVFLSIQLVAYDANHEKVAECLVDNREDYREMVQAEMTVPDTATTGGVLLYTSAPAHRTGPWIDRFVLGIDMTYDGEEGAKAVTTAESSESAGKEEEKDEIASWAMEEQKEEVDDLDDAVEELAKGAVKALIILGVLGIGAIAAIVAVIKGAAAKKAAKAGVKAAGKAEAKETVKAENAGNAEESCVVTDPATGAQTLYIKDADGSWVSSDGNSVLDADKIADWKKTRTEDRAWQDKSNEGLQNPTKFEEIDKQEALENEKIRREAYEEKIAVKHGMDASDMDAVYQKVSSDTAREEVMGQKLQEHAEHVDTVLHITENIKTVADYSVSALGAVTGGAGKAIKDIYAAGTTLSEDIATAAVEGGDVAQAAAGAVAKSAIGVIQNRVDGLGAKAAANIAGNAAGSGVDAYIGGEDVAQGIVKGVASGVAATVVDTGGEMVGALNDDSALKDLAKELVSAANDTAGDIAKNVTSDAIEKSFDKTFKDLNPNKD